LRRWIPIPMREMLACITGASGVVSTPPPTDSAPPSSLAHSLGATQARWTAPITSPLSNTWYLLRQVTDPQPYPTQRTFDSRVASSSYKHWLR
jgi:hypothetical protein